jgi:hypothetical protein
LPNSLQNDEAPSSKLGATINLSESAVATQSYVIENSGVVDGLRSQHIQRNQLTLSRE